MAPQNTVLLMSVDIVGSTPFKAHYGAAAWKPAVEFFFNQAISKVLVATNRVRSPRSGFLALGRMPRVAVHKVKGDEVLFHCWPESLRDIADTLGQFAKVVSELDEVFARDYKLGIHATAWTAGMSIRNHAIPVPHLDTEGAPYYEYVGPDVDIGFRLEGYSPAGRVIVPHELPPLLIGLGMRFDSIGTASLKGVPVDPYPLWLIAKAAEEGSVETNETSLSALEQWSLAE